jgi:Kdo2-lipid IVA lauroyltransferase/acyltransferase
MMQFVYGLFSGLAWLISKMPDRGLYALAGFFAFVMQHLVRYRREIIRDNLKKCFPEFTDIEIKEIANVYYKHMAVLVIEVMKTPGLKADEIKSRFYFKNPEVLHDLEKSGKSVIILTGHLGNWEWLGPGFYLNFPDFSSYAVVKPISDPFFHQYMSNLRMLHNKNTLIPFKQTLRYMIKNQDKHTLTLFAADQTPHRSEIKFKTQFLNQITPFFTGFEKIAKMLDQAVVFTNLYRTKRGYYEVEFHLITDDPKSSGELEITHEFVRLLEKSIRQRPYNWLWSHRRWKYALKEDRTENINTV